MILPSKHISQDQALIGVGALLIERLETPQTVTSLWEKVRTEVAVGTFERYVLALSMLHIIGSVEMNNGLIGRASQ